MLSIYGRLFNLNQSTTTDCINRWAKNGDRLRTDFSGNKFTLLISNAKYNDSGNYFVDVLSIPIEEASEVATLIVHGMFFGYHQWLMCWRKFQKGISDAGIYVDCI